MYAVMLYFDKKKKVPRLHFRSLGSPEFFLYKIIMITEIIILFYSHTSLPFP